MTLGLWCAMGLNTNGNLGGLRMGRPGLLAVPVCPTNRDSLFSKSMEVLSVAKGEIQGHNLLAFIAK